MKGKVNPMNLTLIFTKPEEIQVNDILITGRLIASPTLVGIVTFSACTHGTYQVYAHALDGQIVKQELSAQACIPILRYTEASLMSWQPTLTHCLLKGDVMLTQTLSNTQLLGTVATGIPELVGNLPALLRLTDHLGNESSCNIERDPQKNPVEYILRPLFAEHIATQADRNWDKVNNLEDNDIATHDETEKELVTQAENAPFKGDNVDSWSDDEYIDHFDND